ncbi:glycosyltransferase [Pedobacter sp. HDW13]|uniref:glycosyltransferase family 2 protein n=1 Tax=Pedobacter sp. HDW13 TaxID=2714940 RepID=UPI00140D2C28|nr:glycosyltransferase [Pedobacter sp. HDW13]QIL40275.1 glycosyltransferase [Pedobacter sp. HDW13]
MNLRILISVVLPVYNGQDYIKKAIDSILNQTFDNFELIIIDDCSTDNTVSIIEQFKDKRIRLIRNPTNKGNYACRNIGNSISKGKYIAVMDADDISLPNRLQVQYNYLERYLKLGLVGSFGQFINEIDQKVGILRKPVEHNYIKLFLFRDNCFIHSSMMYRASFLKRFHICYNERLKFAADYDFAIRCSKKFKVMNIPEVLVEYRSHGNQISQEKRIEQLQFADQIRLCQLRQFKIKYVPIELNVHFKMLQIKLCEKDLESAVIWCNRLIEANERFKIYNHKHFYEFLDLTLSFSFQNSEANSWPIEQEMIDFIKDKITSGKKILEFGSGNGTNVLLENFEVHSIEHDIDFVTNRGKSHFCIHSPIKAGWYDRQAVLEVLQQSFDFMLVDGPPVELKAGILDHLDLFTGIECPVIFDDVNRPLDFNVMETFCLRLNYSPEIIQGRHKQFAYCTKQL